MSDAQAVLSFTIEAKESATKVLAMVDQGFAGMSSKVQAALKGIGAEQDKLLAKKPITLVTAEQTAAVDAYDAKLGKLSTTHTNVGKGADLAAKAILGVGLATAVASAKAAVSYDSLERSVSSSTGLSGKALDSFMAQIRQVSVDSTFNLGQVAPVAVALRKAFGDLGDQAGKDAENVLIFAKATGQDANTAVGDLTKTMLQWKIPASDMTTVLDELLTLSQHVPGGIDQITGSLSTMGPQLQAMGFGFNQTLDLMGAFAKAGVSTSAVTRGLSRGLQAAAKDVGVTSGQVGGAIPVIDKYRETLQAAEDRVSTLTATIQAHGYETDADRASMVKAQDAVKSAQIAYSSLKDVLAKAGGEHASIASIVQAEYGEIVNSTNATDRMNASIALFGGRTGPQFARALDDGKTSLTGIQTLLNSSTGAVEKAGVAIENGPTAQWEKFKNEANDLGITIGQVLLPALDDVESVMIGIAKPLDALIAGHTQLAGIIGAGALTGSAGLLLARHSPLGNILGTRAQDAGHSGLANVLQGSGSGAADIWGVLGPVKVGSLTNPMFVRVDGLAAGAGVPGGSAATEEPAAADDAGAATAVAESRAPLVGPTSPLTDAGAAALGAETTVAKEAVPEVQGTLFSDPMGASVAALGEQMMLTMSSEAGSVTSLIEKLADAPAASLPTGFMNAEGAAAARGATQFQPLVAPGKTFTSEGALGELPQGVAAGTAGTATLADGSIVAAGEGGLIASASLSGITDGLKSILPDLLKGGLIAVGGSIAANAAGSAIGGEAGRAVGNVGEGAAIGAGIGSVIPGLGTAVGALAGAAGGGLADLLTSGPKIDAATAEFNALTAQVGKLGAGIDDLSPAQLDALQARFTELAADPSLDATTQQVQKLAAALSPLGIAAKATSGGVTADFSFIASQGGKSLSDIEGSVGVATDYIKQTLPAGSAAANAAMAQAFQSGAAAIQASMTAGTVSVTQGTAAINKIYSQALAAYGVKLPGNSSPTSAAQALSAAQGGDTSLGFNSQGMPVDVAHKAAGGRVPGAVGPDTWTLVDPTGRPAAMVGGGELLVANRHTEAAVDNMLPPGVTLGGMVAGETRPHSMATGGRVTSTGGVTPTSFAASMLQGLGAPVTNANLSALVGWEAQEGGNWNNDARYNPLNTTMPEPGAGNTGTQGNIKVYVSWAQGLQATLATLEGSAYAGIRQALMAGNNAQAVSNAINASPWGTHGARPAAIGGVGATITPGGGTGAVPSGAQITAPTAKGVTGIIGQIAQAALNKITAAANARLGSFGGATSSGTASPGSGLTVTGSVGSQEGPSGLGSFDGLPIAEWIVPELQYAAAHGWHGQITSGYRTPAESAALGFPNDEHTKPGPYPSGAVDFGGMHSAAALANRNAFIRATAGYTGEKLLTPIGFVDDGHMSGTGHALGGRVDFAGAFAGGGSYTATRPTLALFGEGGRAETAYFLPHHETGGVVPGVEQVAVAPKKAAGSTATERYVANKPVGMMTEAQYHAYLLAHPTAKAQADYPITVPEFGTLGTQTETVGTKGTGAVSLGDDVQKMTDTAWSKIVTAITKALKADSPVVQIKAADALSSDSVKQSASARLKDLVASADKAAVAALDAQFKAAQATLTSATTAATQSQSLTSAQWALKNPIGALQPVSVQYAGYKSQESAYAAATKTDTTEESQIKAAIKTAKDHHNTALVTSLTAEFDTIDAALTQTKIDTATLQEQYREAVYTAFTTGIANAATALDDAATSDDTQMQIVAALQHAAGTDDSTLQTLKTNQGGYLTAAQIAQAQSNLSSFTSSSRSEESEYQGEIGVEQAALGSGKLDTADAQAAQQQIQQLTLKIAQLESAITDQVTATQDLITATTANTQSNTLLTGAVSFTYQNQNYIVGGSQTSNDSSAIGLGL